MRKYICNECNEEMNYKDEVVFDGDELKVVDELNPDWSECTCITCFYKEDADDSSSKSESVN